VLLNAHAKRVTESVRDTVAQLVGFENVFLSRDLADANRIAAKVVATGYTTVFAAGGDGTFAGWVHRIAAEADRQARPTPRFGILALGTGNAVAGLVGTGARSWREDLERFLRGKATASRRLDLVDCEGRHTPFAGAGADAALMNDDDGLGTRLRGTATAPPGSGSPPRSGPRPATSSSALRAARSSTRGAPPGASTPKGTASAARSRAASSCTPVRA
jgi:diacylglycerol kinase family enzyme